MWPGRRYGLNLEDELTCIPNGKKMVTVLSCLYGKGALEGLLKWSGCNRCAQSVCNF